jgi:hypothetical protein
LECGHLNGGKSKAVTYAFPPGYRENAAAAAFDRRKNTTGFALHFPFIIHSSVIFDCGDDVALKLLFLGSGLEALKRKLEVGMQKKRTEAFQRREQMYKLENEEGYEGEAMDGLPEDDEEAEMTDKSDTEGEEDEEEEGDFEDQLNDKEKDWVS